MATITETDIVVRSRLRFRLGRLEGRVEELSKAIQDLRAGQRQILLAIIGIGAAQIGLLTMLVVRIAV